MPAGGQVCCIIQFAAGNRTDKPSQCSPPPHSSLLGGRCVGAWAFSAWPQFQSLNFQLNLWAFPFAMWAVLLTTPHCSTALLCPRQFHSRFSAQRLRPLLGPTQRPSATPSPKAWPSPLADLGHFATSIWFSFSNWMENLAAVEMMAIAQGRSRRG